MPSSTPVERAPWSVASSRSSVGRGWLDRCCSVDPYNLLTKGPSDFESMELTWQGRLLGQSIGAQLGYEKQSPAGAGNADGVYGFIQWRKAL